MEKQNVECVQNLPGPLKPKVDEQQSTNVAQAHQISLK